MIKTSDSSDSGMYIIHAENELGSVDAKAELQVQHAPRVLADITSVAVFTNETVRLDLELEANPKPDIEWRKNGEHISETSKCHASREQSLR